MTTIKKKLYTLIAAYDNLVKGIDNAAIANNNRAYGGIIRAGKGALVENITSQLVQIAWCDVLQQNPNRLTINKKKMPIGINDKYINSISNPLVQSYVKTNRNKMIYKFGTDVQVFVDDKLVLPIECKTYTENAMLKRILFDAELMKEAAGLETYYLVQLESQLGGDYSELNNITYGSPATHALLAHSDVNLVIITLLKGERHVKKPIHKPGFFKELNISELQKAIQIFADALKKFTTQ